MGELLFSVRGGARRRFGVRRVAWVAALAFTCALQLSRAHAATLEEGERLAENADFEAALAALNAAEEAGELERAAVLRLYKTRALVLFALQRPEALESDLKRLCALGMRGQDMPRAAPPAFRKEVDATCSRGGRPLQLRLEGRREGEGVVLTALTPPGQDTSWGESFRLWYRPQGEPGWQEHADRSLKVRLAETLSLQYYGAIVSKEANALVLSGTRQDPFTIPAVDKESDRTLLWVGLGVGGAVVLAAAIVAIVVLTRGSAGDTTQLSPPVILP